jgi:hypothetical protein
VCISRTLRDAPERVAEAEDMRTMFWLYLVFIVTGLVVYTIVGVGHY